MDNVAKDSALTTSNTVAVGEDVYTNLFINPYIGRVVNGFAIEEGKTFGKSTNLINGRKNYLFTQFKSELTFNMHHLSFKMQFTLRYIK